MNNVKMMTAAEMENINGGHEPYIDPSRIGIELPNHRSGLLDHTGLFPDVDWHGLARRRRPDAPDMIDPDLLHRLTEEIKDITPLQ